MMFTKLGAIAKRNLTLNYVKKKKIYTTAFKTKFVELISLRGIVKKVSDALRIPY